MNKDDIFDYVLVIMFAIFIFFMIIAIFTQLSIFFNNHEVINELSKVLTSLKNI